MSSSEELYTKGARIWIPDPERVWRGAELLRDYKTGDKELLIQTEDDEETLTLPLPRTSGNASNVDLPPLRNPEILIGRAAWAGKKVVTSDRASLACVGSVLLILNDRFPFVFWHQAKTT